MIPILYHSNETEFTNMGLGALTDATSCTVIEERNGIYELTMSYPKCGIHFSDILLNRIIYAVPSPYRNPQPFRIYKISSTMRGDITIKAQHISYDLSGVTVMPFSGLSVADIMNKITTNSVNTNRFSFSGNSALIRECEYTTPNSARQILGGMSGSIIDIFGGEYEFDRFNVLWHENRGANNGVTIRYGKNLLNISQDVDMSGIISGVVPYWSDFESESAAVIGDVIYMDGESTVDRIIPLDLTDKFEEQPTKSQLNDRARTYIKSNYSLDPEFNCDISFALIEQSEEYKEYRVLEKCDLCDIITVVYPDLNVNSTAKIVKIKTDVLRDRYDSVTIGTVRANIAQTIVAQEKAVENIPSNKDVGNIVQGALNGILGASGGSVRLLDTNDDGELDTLYIADKSDPTQAKKVWRFNYLGWAASKNGYNGPFEMGATLDDGLLANFVTAANLVAGTIKSIDDDTFFLDLTNGILNMNANSLTIAGESIDSIASRIANNAVNAQTQQDIFNKLTKNGTIQGLYMQNGELYINASYLQSGSINANLITTGELNADLIKAGTIKSTTGNTTFAMNNGDITCKYGDAIVRLRSYSGAALLLEYGGTEVGSVFIAGAGGSTVESTANIQVYNIGAYDSAGIGYKNFAWKEGNETVMQVDRANLSTIQVSNGLGGSLYWETIRLQDGRTCKALCSWS